MFRLIKKHDSLAKRIILLAFTTISLSIILTGSAIYWNFQKSQDRSLTTYLDAYIDIFISSTSIDEDGNVVVGDEVDIFQSMPFYWQITSGDMKIKKSNLINDWINTDNLTENVSDVYIAEHQALVTNVIKRITFPGDKEVTYLFGIQSEIAAALLNEGKAQFVNSLFISMILLAFFLIVIIAFVLVRTSTLPLQRIKDEIIDIHDGKKSKLSNNFPKEIRLLAKEINKLTEYNMAIIERYRTFAANLSHSLRTPLTIINNEAQNSSSKLAKTVRAKSEDMLGIIERNLTRVRSHGKNDALSVSVDVHPIVKKITDSFGKLYKKETEIVKTSANIKFRGNQSDLYEILGNLIENACKYSENKVRVTLDEKNKKSVIIIEDDGSGIPKNKINDVLQHGTRLDMSKPGSGVGLAVTNDIVKLYGGVLEFGKSEMGGLRVEFRV